MGNQFSRTFWLYLGVLLLLNLVQSYFTPLIYDETYYWYYAQNLSWGYFDHPPMVALLAKVSSLFFNGELGVRFVSCLMNCATIMVLWVLVEHKEKQKYIRHFFLLCFGMVLFNAYGFFTLPDTPLLFFSALFLLIYKKFLEKNNLQLAVLLGLCMAALMYSKYHAVLVIMFVLFSNLGLLKNKLAWVAVGIALFAYVPHFIWLFENDFISVKYHLFERPNQPYSFDEFTLGYFLNLAVNFGLLFPWFYLSLFKARPKDKFRRALLFVSYGIIAFFFLSSFHRRAQAQWVIAICIPMLVFAFEYLLEYKKSRTWMTRLALVSLVLVCYARVWLVHQPLIPFMVYETHGTKEWVKALNEIVGDTPVVFENSYRRAPMYAFYAGDTTFSLNNIFYRQNQYSIDRSEELVRHKRVAYVTPFADSGEFSYVPFRSNTYYGWYIENFESYRKLRCEVANTPIELTKTREDLLVYNPYPDSIPLNILKFNIAYLDEYKDIIETHPITLKSKREFGFLKPRDTTYFSFSYPAFTKKRPNFIKFSISENGLLSGINSESIKVAE